MQDELRGAALDFAEGNFAKKGNGILIELAPARRVEIAKKADAFVVPGPPEVARQSPEPFLRGSHETVEGASLTDYGRDFAGGFAQAANLIVAKHARFLGLNDED